MWRKTSPSEALYGAQSAEGCRGEHGSENWKCSGWESRNMELKLQPSMFKFINSSWLRKPHWKNFVVNLICSATRWRRIDHKSEDQFSHANLVFFSNNPTPLNCRIAKLLCWLSPRQLENCYEGARYYLWKQSTWLSPFSTQSRSSLVVAWEFFRVLSPGKFL